MRFTLFYKGNLKSNGRAKDKHSIRTEFHNQLRELWNQPPLDSFSEKFLGLTMNGTNSSIIQDVGDFQFAPLVNNKLHMTADLNITMLRPGRPGSLITHAGDIDNRLKTLLDALKVPEPGALPKDARPTREQVPFFTLLEDDVFITGLSVGTDRLLDSNASKSEVILLIHVTTYIIEPTWLSISLSG